jgi:hypothetical protein
MEGQDTERATRQNQRDGPGGQADDRNEELDESPAPDPEEASDPDAEDDPEAD